MTQPPDTMPPPNGHSHTSPVRTNQPIRDRWGRPYVLRGEFSRSHIRFALSTPNGVGVGHFEITIQGVEGRLHLLHIAEGPTVPMPRLLRRVLARILPANISGHRDRGLGSLLLIYGMRAACDLGLKQVIAPDVPPPAAGLFRTLGFALTPSDARLIGIYRISD